MRWGVAPVARTKQLTRSDAVAIMILAQLIGAALAELAKRLPEGQKLLNTVGDYQTTAGMIFMVITVLRRLLSTCRNSRRSMEAIGSAHPLHVGMRG